MPCLEYRVYDGVEAGFFLGCVWWGVGILSGEGGGNRPQLYKKKSRDGGGGEGGGVVSFKF